jgi:hypothetical protein
MISDLCRSDPGNKASNLFDVVLKEWNEHIPFHILRKVFLNGERYRKEIKSFLMGSIDDIESAISKYQTKNMKKCSRKWKKMQSKVVPKHFKLK